MYKQTIPVIISEKGLKNFFSEVFKEINTLIKYKFELVDLDEAKVSKSLVFVLDFASYTKLLNLNLTNKKYFIFEKNDLNSVKITNQCTLIKCPFKISELTHLVENYIDQITKRDQKKINFKLHSFDPLSRKLFKGHNSVRFTEKESEIFVCLLESNGKYLNKTYLLEKVWHYNQEIDTHTLETHLYSLRKKIDKKLGTKNLIKHEESKGYTIDKSIL